MTVSIPNTNIKMKNSTFIIFFIALELFIASLYATFAAADYHDKTRTPPLVKLTLRQLACEHLSQSGIPAEVRNGICMITARYQELSSANSGYVEVTGKPPLKIGSGLIVASIQLDDGSSEPWAEEHRKAFSYLLGSVALMLLSLGVVAFMSIRSERK